MESQRTPLRIGITGASGFIGRHLAASLAKITDFQPIPLDRKGWESNRSLAEWMDRCDAIFHLAGVNRHPDPNVLYRTNVTLASTLARAFERSAHLPAIFYISSIREGENTPYGRAKSTCRAILEAVVREKQGHMVSLRLPNVFGPGAAPYDNSYIATFSHQLLTGRLPVVTEEREVPLLFIESLCNQLTDSLLTSDFLIPGLHSYTLSPDFRLTVRQTLVVLEGFAAEYRIQGRVTPPPDPDMARLLETFLSHLPE